MFIGNWSDLKSSCDDAYDDDSVGVEINLLLTISSSIIVYLPFRIAEVLQLE